MPHPAPGGSSSFPEERGFASSQLRMLPPSAEPSDPHTMTIAQPDPATLEAAARIVAGARQLRSLPGDKFDAAMMKLCLDNLAGLGGEGEDMKEVPEAQPEVNETSMVLADDAYEKQRRLSIVFGDAGGSIMDTMATGLLHNLSLLQPLTDKQVQLVSRSFIDCVKASHDAAKDIGVWFDKKMPQVADEHKVLADNFRRILAQIGKVIRPGLKMARIGLTVKLTMSTLLSYSDLVTDILVVEQFYDQALSGWGDASIACVGFSLFVQAFLTWQQYGQRSAQERITRTLMAASGLGPLVEGYYVWTEKTGDMADLSYNPEFMLALLKATEIAVESIPESVIQMSLVVGMSSSAITPVQWVSLLSSFAAGGYAPSSQFVLPFPLTPHLLTHRFINTEGNLSFVRAQALGAPGNPFFKWVPSETGQFARCALGLFSFSASFFFMFVFTLSMLFHATGSFKAVAILTGAEIGTVLCYKAWQRELFGFMINATSSPQASAGNILFVSVSVLLSSTSPLLNISFPGNMGPHVFAGIIIWRMVSSAPIIFMSAREVATKDGYWITVQAAMSAYGAAMIVSVGGLLVFFRHLDPSFEKWRFWRPQTGRQMVAEMMLDTRMWTKPDDEIKNKDDESWSWVGFLAPYMQPMDTICDWSERLADKYENAATRPKWLTADTFAPRIRYLCKVEGTAAETARLEAVLARLFTELPPPSPSAAARSKVAPSPSPSPVT